MITTADTIMINNDKFISSGFGDEMMLMNLETGDYIGLNSVCADIWGQAEKKITAQQIIDYLLQQYDVGEEICKREVLTAMQQMLEKGLLIYR